MSNVRDFGALGNDLADDTAAFLGAIRAGGPLVIPRGIYRITGIDYNSLKDSGAVVDDIRWEGDGANGSVVKYTGTGSAITAGRVAPFYGPSFVMRNLTLTGVGIVGHTSRIIGGYTTTSTPIGSGYGSGTTSTQRGIVLSSITVPGPLLDYVRLRHFDVAITTMNCYHVHLTGCSIQTGNIGFKLGPTTTAVVIEGTEVAGQAVGVWLAGSGIQLVTIRDCVFESNFAGTAILSNGGESLNVRDSYFSANVDNLVHNPLSGFADNSFAEGWVIEGNFGISASFGDYVRLVVMRDNLADDTGTYSIRNQYSINAGMVRRIYVYRNWAAFTNPVYSPYTKYDGTQAAEFNHTDGVPAF